ncbi:rRNA maturation RNase YbeY [Bacillus sp. Y1]|jgi:probable rRNA maturation factor|uniref:rRNA maturation RNase YbeY n=1 Tax=Robertmurraya sp. TaxID=2837525 RepID=UPI000E6B28B8|nr:rRNA maturation RNase YbeY [Bacillus sp. Y1]AYA77068.1 rRNA maturation RNase YbeY [Bacillus sp. Y1]
MNLSIDFLDETNEMTEEAIEQIEGVLNSAQKKLQITEPCELSVTFVDNDRIQEINREYRGKDKPTDVISFALEELGEGEIQISGANMPRVLGDIIISTDKAREQATDYGHSVERELGFLAVHGFLHLLGYDHETEAEEKEMFDLQRSILDEYGLGR